MEMIILSSLLPYTLHISLIVALNTTEHHFGLPLSLLTEYKLLYCRNFDFGIPMPSVEEGRKEGKRKGRRRGGKEKEGKEEGEEEGRIRKERRWKREMDLIFFSILNRVALSNA